MPESLEEDRHQHEVRQVLRWRAEDRNKALQYLSAVRQKRGNDAADRLQKDCAEQWSKGNKGVKGDWR